MQRGAKFLGTALLLGFAQSSAAFEIIHGGTFDLNGDDPNFSGVVDYYDHFGRYAPIPELKGSALTVPAALSSGKADSARVMATSS